MKLFFSVFTITAILAATVPGVKTASAAPAKNPISLAAKLYWIAQTMDKHDNWLAISKLLHQTLEEDLSNPFLRSRLKKVKQYVDREMIRQSAGAVTGGRLDTHSFLEARLLIVECIQELRPRLNLSWTGEVRHLKKMLYTAIFPHMEEFGEIEFPAPKTYSFDTYGYTIKNIKALLVGKGGKDVKPLFKQFLGEVKKRRPLDDDDDDFGSNMYFHKLSYFKDRIHSALLTEGIDPDKNPALPSDWDPTTGSGGSPTWEPGDDTVWPGSDWDYKIASLKRAYKYIKNVLSAMRNHHSTDEYEPLTLLMIAVSNPGLIEHDPQLKDFIKGVKFKLKLTTNGSDGSGFKLQDYQLVKLVNDSLVPQANVKLQFETDNKTGQIVLYLVSNFNGSTNVAMNLLSFKNIVTIVQAIKYMPESVFSLAKLTPESVSKAVDAINAWIKRMTTEANPFYRFVGYNSQVIFDVVMTLGGKTVSKAAEALGKIIKKIAAHPKTAKALQIAKSEGFLRTMVAVSVGADITMGVLELLQNHNPHQTPKIAIRTASKVSGTLIYLAKKRPAILIAAGFDIGHLIYDKIPSVSKIFESIFKFGYGKFVYLRTGHSPRELELIDLKKQLGIEDHTEAQTLLVEFEQATKTATDLKQLEVAKAKLSQRLGMYAARRLFFHYVTITALGGKGERDLGFELKRQSNEYDRVYWTWFNPPGGKEKEQAGLSLLDRDFDKKWVGFGGKLPEKPSPDSKKSDQDKDGKKGDKKKRRDDDWDDGDDEKGKKDDIPPWKDVR